MSEQTNLIFSASSFADQGEELFEARLRSLPTQSRRVQPASIG
jgi:hypothetical protein